MSEFIEIISPKALEDLDKATAKVVELVSNIDKANQKFKGITTPSGVDTALKGLANEYVKHDKLLAELQIKLQKVAQAQQQTITATNRAEASTMRLNKQKEAQIKALEREQAKLEASANLYNKVQAKLNVLSNEYKNLATKKELFNNLTAKEEQRYASLQTKIQKYDQVLKGVDASMGKYQRNVGNYASAFNPLSNSINQLTREMPAFANSVQTGFMAISNNLPVFFDSIGNIIEQNKQLQAQGQPTKSVLSQIASSIFSWGTALSVGVTLLTVYGKDIVEFFTNLTVAEKMQAELSKTISEASSGYSESVLKIETLTKVVKDNTETEQNRIIAYNELKKIIPELETMTMNQAIATGYLTQITDKYVTASIKRAIADKFAQKIADEQMKLEIKRAKLLTEQGIAENQSFYEKYIAGIDPESFNKRMKEQDSSTVKFIDTLKKLYKENLLIAEQLESELLGLDKKTKGTDKHTNAIKRNTEEKKKNANIKDDFLSKDTLERSINGLQSILDSTSKLSPAYNVLNGSLQKTKDLYELLYGSTKKQTEATKELAEGVSIADEELYSDYYTWLKLHNATNEYLKTISSDAFNKAFDNIGFKSAKMFLDFDQNGQSTFDKLIEGAQTFKEKFGVTFQAISEVAQETFNFISELNNKRFQNQYEELEKEYKINLAFAGDSVSAREEIERQYRDRQREIKRREFKAKQQEALANIAMDTAQAIIGLWVKPGFPQAIPMAITVGALGLAQMAMVASQQIPQYWTGTDNAKQGWAWTQEKGREIITDKHGRVKSTGSDGGAKLTYLEQGDKVYNATKSALMFDSALNSMLMDRGVSMPKIEVGSGLNESHVNRIVEAVRDIDPVSLNIDKSGLNAYVGNGHSRRELANMRVRGKGRNV